MKMRLKTKMKLAALAGMGLLTGAFLLGHASESRAQENQYREQLVPILGVTLESEPIGTVANLIVLFEDRGDQGGLVVQFKAEPGRFSRMAQTAIEQAIYRTAHAAGLSTDSWTVMLSVPYPHLVVYGESLSAMVALAVIALAKGEFIPPDRVVTGIVTPEGYIAAVGAVPLKVVAANAAHMRRVVVPDEMDVADGDWVTPFLVQVSPVRSVSEAYQALTDHPLRP
jgi:predicted S18 family serine protease